MAAGLPPAPVPHLPLMIVVTQAAVLQPGAFRFRLQEVPLSSICPLRPHVPGEGDIRSLASTLLLWQQHHRAFLLSGPAPTGNSAPRKVFQSARCESQATLLHASFLENTWLLLHPPSHSHTVDEGFGWVYFPQPPPPSSHSFSLLDSRHSEPIAPSREKMGKAGLPEVSGKQLFGKTCHILFVNTQARRCTNTSSYLITSNSITTKFHVP